MKIKDSSETIAVRRPTWPFPVFSREAPLRLLQRHSGLLTRAWRWIRERQAARSATKRLHVAASVSLGEKRFAAVIEVDGLQFLVGGGATNVSLLAQLNPGQSFGDALQKAAAPEEKPAKRTRKPAAKRAAVQPAAIKLESSEQDANTSEPTRPAAMKPVAVRPESIQAAAMKPAVMKAGGLQARKRA